MNIDINFFLLLKNELSLAFLRKEENILQTLRLAMHIDAKEEKKEFEADAAKFKIF